MKLKKLPFKPRSQQNGVWKKIKKKMKEEKKAIPAKKEIELEKQNEALKTELRDLNTHYQKEITELKEKIKELEKNQRPEEKKVPSASVFINERLIITYDLEKHGEKYKELAKQFVSKKKSQNSKDKISIK